MVSSKGEATEMLAHLWPGSNVRESGFDDIGLTRIENENHQA